MIRSTQDDLDAALGDGEGDSVDATSQRRRWNTKAEYSSGGDDGIAYYAINFLVMVWRRIHRSDSDA
jgi:hypothetical protein